MESLKKSAVRVKNHITRHKVGYAIAGTATVFVALQYHASGEWEKFMISKGIDPREYFLPESLLEQ